MSQPSVAAYFNTRKRQANEELRSKAKVLLLEQEQSRSTVSKEGPWVASTECQVSGSQPQEEKAMGTSPKIVLVPGRETAGTRTPKGNPAVRNIQFDSPKVTASKASKSTPRARATRSRKLSSQEGHLDIRESFQKIVEDQDAKKIPFEKKGALSPRKKQHGTPKKNSALGEAPAPTNATDDQSVGECLTPKKNSGMGRAIAQDLTITEIKNRINKSSRLMELKASIARIKNCEQRLEQIQKPAETKKLQIQKFDKIQLEIPVSPQKAYKSPSKALISPSKRELLKASPQRRILFEPKEKTPSPVKGSPTKAPAYQQYLSLAESGTPALALPYNYRFLAEVFRCVETVSAMLFNRKETITFKKLKPAVQELLRRNIGIEHLAQIKTILPEAYTFHQEKLRNFGSTSKQDKYELVMTPRVEEKETGRNSPDADNILKTGSESSMGPRVLLERRRKFYNVLLDRVKDQHEKFLLSLETPMRIPREKILRWHPEFDVETCAPIEQADIPQPPNVEKASSVQNVLDKAKSLFSCGTRMEKALQRLAEAKMTSKSSNSPEKSTGADMNGGEPTELPATEDGFRKVDVALVDTPPATPTTQNSYLSTAFKGIPKALLEKVRAKQAAKALEAMTRTPNADKEAAMYSRLPELAKILRNIFVAEKKGILTMEFVVTRLDNSFRTKLTPRDLEDHVRLLCKLLPTWTSVHNVRKIDYLKLNRDLDLGAEQRWRYRLRIKKGRAGRLCVSVRVLRLPLTRLARDTSVCLKSTFLGRTTPGIMLLTNVLLKKVKSKHVLVIVESLASGHQLTRVKERATDKLELVNFDPYIQRDAVYREIKKIRSFP